MWERIDIGMKLKTSEISYDFKTVVIGVIGVTEHSISKDQEKLFRLWRAEISSVVYYLDRFI